MYFRCRAAGRAFYGNGARILSGHLSEQPCLVRFRDRLRGADRFAILAKTDALHDECRRIGLDTQPCRLLLPGCTGRCTASTGSSWTDDAQGDDLVVNHLPNRR